MTNPKKKPKTGDVVGWVVLDRDGDVYDHRKTRQSARFSQRDANRRGYYKPYVVAKIVLAK